jgi:hypothetical protein
MSEFFEALENLQLSVWVRESGSIWAYPTVLFLHTLGMSMVAGVSSVIDLVILGIWPKASIRPLERLYPFMWTGFVVNAVTGTILLIADASYKLTNPDFYAKMAFIIVGVTVLYKMRTKVFGDPQLDNGPVPRNAKTLAWVSLACWFGAITAGRLLAYVGPVAGLG